MLTGVCMIVLAIVACMMGTDMKEAKVLYYDAEFELDNGSFKVTTTTNTESSSDSSDESEDAAETDEGAKPKSTKGSLRSVGKSADPVQYSAQEIYNKLDRK